MRIETIKKEIKKLHENPISCIEILMILESEIIRWIAINYRQLIHTICMCIVSGPIFTGVTININIATYGYVKLAEYNPIILSLEIISMITAFIYLVRMGFKIIPKLQRSIHYLGYVCIGGAQIFQILIFTDIALKGYFFMKNEPIILIWVNILVISMLIPYVYFFRRIIGPLNLSHVK